jgi:steroid 5-alpha reductase family enzyme
MDVMLLIFVYFFIFFIVGTLIKNNSIVDMGWGIGFVMVAWFVFLRSESQPLPQILMKLFVSIWGLRLFYHILKRNLGKPEDFRYATWRKEWGKFDIPRAFLQVYTLQGVFMFLVSLAVILFPSQVSQVSLPVMIAGACIWILGFFFEAVGDYQLKVFIAIPTTAAKSCRPVYGGLPGIPIILVRRPCGGASS